jgi:cysteine desulfurase NifS/selenium donor protein
VNHPIYLDYNATTPIHPEVLQAMMPYLQDAFGNPSSNHSYGSEARIAVEKARGQVAALLGCKSYEIIFTSGGSESNNLAIKGVAHHYRDKGNHIITSAIEHPAVTEVCRHLEREGFNITYLSVDRFGQISLEELENAIRPDTILITIMHANNEIGTLQPVREIAGIAKQHGIFFHTDAAQSAGKVSVENLGADLVSLAGHKLYAPKGIGVLYKRDDISLEKLIHGADHERNLRAGTENVAFIAGLGKACELAHQNLVENSSHAQAMRDLLQEKLLESIPEAVVNGHPTERLPNTLSISFPGIDANLILSEISDRIAASAGAACHAGGTDISATLTAIELPFNTARGTIRFSTGIGTSEEEILSAAEIVVETLGNLVGSWQSAVGSRQSAVGNQQSAVEKLEPGTWNPLPGTNTSPPLPPAPYSPSPNWRGGQGVRPNSVPNLTLNPQPLKLTQFTAGLGCACKLRPQVLEQVLKSLPPLFHPDILVGTENSDDAAVYRINNDQAIVQTLDFFTPIVDDPYTFGAIAAANALSDIYAMGARPLFALNIVAFPTNRLPMEVLEQILKGASDKAAEAGIYILGGHTIDDPEPKFGMAVTGIVHPDKILRNKGAQPGDALILTKPLGTGVLATAMKRGMLEGVGSRQSAVGSLLTSPPGPLSKLERGNRGAGGKGGEVEPGTRNPEFISSMLSLSKAAAEVMAGFPVSACTDITGFGLLGHLHEMTSASGVDAEIVAATVPILPGALEMTSAGMVPGGTLANRDYTAPFVNYGPGVGELMQILLNDAQTSGGLLIVVPESVADEMVEQMRTIYVNAIRIGHFLRNGDGRIQVV